MNASKNDRAMERAESNFAQSEPEEYKERGHFHKWIFAGYAEDGTQFFKCMTCGKDTEV